MSRIRVGVVRGGPSSEYVVSLKTGENVLAHLDTEKYTPIDILVTPRGDWYMNGMRTELGDLSHHVDVMWNAMHGSFGEDGKVQQQFESYNIPYTGSGVMASAVGMHKELAKERFREAKLLVPYGEVIPATENMYEVAFQLFRNRHLPVIVKPVAGGSSVATKIVRNYEELRTALIEASEHGDVLVEDYIQGKEATVCVIDSATSGQHLVLYPIEIVPPEQQDFFTYDAKYSGESDEICPGRFTLTTHSTLRELATKAHRAIGARHYSRSDFIVTPEGIYLLEINTLPGLTENSLLPKALKAGNVEFKHFLDHVIELAIKK
jgi:D-alanine-D-alanine ligase